MRKTPLGVGGFGGGIGVSSNNLSQPLRAAGSLVLIDSVVRNNDSRVGAGILASGDQLCGSPSPICNPGTAPRASVQITQSLIADNVAGLYGGGLRIDRTDFTMTGSHVLRNSVLTSGQSYGGGFLLALGSIATIDTTTIARNASVNFGGGLFVDEGVVLNLSNSRVYANTSANGGGLYVGNNGTSSGTIQNSTLADNSNNQVHEQACSPLVRTILNYSNNNIVPRSGYTDLYFSTCGGGTSTISGFNALPNGRASGNTSTTPSFVSFLATPDIASAVLSWSVSRASSVAISGVGSSADDTGSTNVTPGSQTTYTLTNTGGPASNPTAFVGVARAWGAPTDTPVSGDFDGDGRNDRAVYRSTTGEWFLLRSTAGFRQQGWGAYALGDIPVAADYDGDGTTDIAVFRQSTGQWFILRSTGGSAVVQWGNTALGDVPVARDYDGDSKADIAVFRKSTGQWFINRSLGGSTAVSWGAPSLGDTPVPHDYDGDGKADIGVYRASTGGWYISMSSGAPGPTIFWGAPSSMSLGDTPVPADYDGDGKADIAVARAATGDWFVRGSAGGVIVLRWGLGDHQLSGDYDGDGDADIAIWRAATGSWLAQP